MKTRGGGWCEGKSFFFFRVRVSVFFLLKVSKLPPLKNQFSMVFIGKLLLGFSTWSLNFFLFVNFDFSCFFVFF